MANASFNAAVTNKGFRCALGQRYSSFSMEEFYAVFKEFYGIEEDESEEGRLFQIPYQKHFLSHKRWTAQARQHLKINSCSSREAVYLGKRLRKTFLKMHNGDLAPLFWCKELADENIACNFTGIYKHGYKYKWQLVDEHTPLRYITPFSVDVARANCQFRRGGYRKAPPANNHVV